MNEIIYVKSKSKDLISKVEKIVRDVISQQDDIAEVGYNDVKPEVGTAYSFADVINFLKHDINCDYAFSCVDSFKTTQNGYGNEYVTINREIISDTPYIMKCDQFKNFYPYIPTFPEMFIYRWRLLKDDELID